jgi:PAS domain S-box-containing protein
MRLLGGFGLVLVLGAAQSTFAYQTAAENVAAADAQGRSERIASLSAATRTAVLQMEAGYRGYFLVGNPGFLASYTAGAEMFTADVAELEQLSIADHAKVALWRALERRVAAWQSDIIHPGIALRSLSAAVVPGVQEDALGLPSAATSQQDIKGIQRILDQAVAAEQADVLERHVATVATNDRFMATLLWGTLAELGLGLVVAFLFARHLGFANARVRSGERRFRQMFDNNPSIKLLIDPASGAIIEANQAACDFYGYSHTHLLHRHITDLNPMLTAAIAGAKLAQTTVDGRTSIVERHRLASGELRDVDIRSSPVDDDASGRVLVYLIIHDITERMRAEEALRGSEERFRKQYLGFPLPTSSWVRVGNDFVLQDFNDAAEAITGGYIRHWVGKTASDCYTHQPEVLAGLQACVAEQRTITQEMRYRYRATGSDRDLAVSFVFVPPLTVMLHTEDITERQQAEQQREAMARSEKLRALGQMATGIAHDLNQSLMLVASYSDLARQALVQEPPNLLELENLLTTTTQAALDGGETVKRLLQFTRTAPEQDGQLVDLSTVVHDAAQLTAPRWRDSAQAEGRAINLIIEAEGIPTVLGSPGRLRELMINLIFNAVDALPAGGTIRLRALAEDGQGIVEVVDTGVGMSAADQARAFEPFFTTKGESGTGLGLPMVFGIVEQHRGHIEVRSAPGEGTTIRMRFPLVAASEAAKLASAPAQVQRSRPLRVLTVDDEPMMTKAVVRMLKPLGHVVVVAGSGEEAIEKLTEQTFDVVVSDMGMGAGMDGMELAAAVKHRWPDVRFLLATGWGAAIDPSEARASGVEAIHSKP